MSSCQLAAHYTTCTNKVSSQQAKSSCLNTAAGYCDCSTSTFQPRPPVGMLCVCGRIPSDGLYMHSNVTIIWPQCARVGCGKSQQGVFLLAPTDSTGLVTACFAAPSPPLLPLWFVAAIKLLVDVCFLLCLAVTLLAGCGKANTSLALTLLGSVFQRVLTSSQDK